MIGFITAERQYFMPTVGTYPPLLLGGLQFCPGLQALEKICYKSPKKKHINNIVFLVQIYNKNNTRIKKLQKNM